MTALAFTLEYTVPLVYKFVHRHIAKLVYLVLFVVFLNLRRWIFLRRWIGFFYPLNSLNCVRICAGTPLSTPRDLQKHGRVIARFSCYSTKKILNIVRNFAKSYQHTIFWLFAYGAVLKRRLYWHLVLIFWWIMVCLRCEQSITMWDILVYFHIEAVQYLYEVSGMTVTLRTLEGFHILH